MGWFHKTLTEMDEEIENGDWERVTEIINRHSIGLGRKDSTTKNISNISKIIKEYTIALVVLREYSNHPFENKNQQKDERTVKKSY